MAELADAHGSGPCESNFMQVQVLLPAPRCRRYYLVSAIFLRRARMYSARQKLCRYLKRIVRQNLSPHACHPHKRLQGLAMSTRLKYLQIYALSIYILGADACAERSF